jgi:CO/xanthine dehydrogenase FAD-binding subunit
MTRLHVAIPESIDEALGLLGKWGREAAVIAGGTDLVVELKDRLKSPKALIDIGRVPEISGIRETEGGDVWIGALSTHAEVASSTVVKETAPVLADACAQVGSPQIRNRGTIGGNISTASPAGDTIPALYVLEASVEIIGPKGKRVVPIESFFQGPKKSALAFDEIVLGVKVPKLGKEYVSFFRKLGQRKSLAISIVSVAFAGRCQEPGLFTDVRIAFGAVAPTVVRARTVEKAICNMKLDPKSAQYISKLAFRDCVPITDVRGSQGYREVMACNLLYEGLLEMGRVRKA